MEKRYVWYLCLVLWLPDDALMKVFLFRFMKPGRARLRCSQMTGRVIMLLEFPGVNEHEPGHMSLHQLPGISRCLLMMIGACFDSRIPH